MRSAAVGALGSIGILASAAVPALIEMIMRDEETLPPRQSAANTLWRLGPRSEVAVPALLEALRRSPVNPAVQTAFRSIRPVSPKVTEYLTRALDEPNAVVLDSVLRGLRRMGPAAGVAVPALIGLLKTNSTPAQRLDVIVTLGSIGPDARAAVPALVQMLDEPDSRARRLAATELGNIQVTDRTAVRRLVRALQDADEDVRTAALDALYEIGWGPETN